MADTTIANPTSASFVRARLSAQSLADFPGDLPTSLEEAYAIQNESIHHWPDEVAGWKVGGIPGHFVEQYGSDRLAGPIFRRAIAYQNGEPTVMPVFDGGFAAVEAEIVLRTDREIAPGSLDPRGTDVIDAVPDAFLGIELASSPLAQINDLGPMSIISDFGNNAGLVVGRKIADWPRTDLSGREITVTIDGEKVGQAQIAPLEKGPLASFRFLLQNCADRGITLPAGTFVSTGAITGVHRCEAGARAVIDFAGMASMEISLVKASPAA